MMRSLGLSLLSFSFTQRHRRVVRRGLATETLQRRGKLSVPVAFETVVSATAEMGTDDMWKGQSVERVGALQLAFPFEWAANNK